MEKSRFHADDSLRYKSSKELFFGCFVSICEAIIAMTDTFQISFIAETDNITGGNTCCNKVRRFCNAAAL